MLRRTLPARRLLVTIPRSHSRPRYNSGQQQATPPLADAQQPQAPYEEPPRPNIYKQFGRPFAKVFLGAMFTYQVLYWCWEKMRTEEIREERMEEIEGLEREVEEYKARQTGT